jgi:L-threonylcarbamoyladenylate synthase
MKYKHYSPKAKIILAESRTDLVPKDILDFRLELSNTDESSQIDSKGPTYEQMQNGVFKLPVIGVLRTRHWAPWGGFNESSWTHVVPSPLNSQSQDMAKLNENGQSHVMWNLQEGHIYTSNSNNDESPLLLAKIIEIYLGCDTKAIAHGLFSALRELDKRGVDLIYVEGIEDDGHDLFQNSNGRPAPGRDEGNIAAAIMNRLRKAATVVKP